VGVAPGSFGLRSFETSLGGASYLFLTPTVPRRVVSERRYFESAARELVKQGRARRRRSSQALASEAARTYADLLDDLFFYYRESIRAAERGTREG
jgi:hypothetical protein